MEILTKILIAALLIAFAYLINRELKVYFKKRLERGKKKNGSRRFKKKSK
jgi:hypothetical protein